MATKLDKDMMKKQHFWLLLIPLFIGLLLAWLGLFFGVADATEEKLAENDKEKKAVENAKAQSKKTLALYDERKEELFKLRTQRWLEMWNLQQAIYEWPAELGEEQIAKVKDLKFGTQINDTQFINQFRDEGMKGYEKLATDVAPIQFAGDWRTALRTVPAWKRNPASEDIWLAAEDYWVQREILMALAGVNTAAASFKRPSEISPTDPRFPQEVRTKWKDDPKERTFIGRTWQLDLKLVEKAGSPTLEGSITNLTPRLQPFNANGELLFKVYLSDDKEARPFYFAIEGTTQEGLKTEPIKFVARRHTINEGRTVELYKIEQVFDVRTVPVKRVDKVALGQKSDRHRLAELQMPAFSTKAVEDESAAAAAAGGTASGPGALPTMGLGGSSAGPPPGVGGATAVGPPGFGGAGTATSTDLTYNGLARRRYVNITNQVRAMPVGLLVVADQGFVPDVLTAMANSKLRFQTVQNTLVRFRGSLSYVAQGLGGFPPGIMPMEGEGGRGGSSAGPPPAVGPPPGPGGSSAGPPPVGGSSSGPPGGSSLGPPAGGGPPRLPGPGGGGPPGVPGVPGFPPAMPGMFPPGGFGPGFGGGPTSSSDDQTAGNLIEIELYGIASLYEKFDPNAAKKDEPAGTTTPSTAPTTPGTGTTTPGTGTTTSDPKAAPMTPPEAPGKEGAPAVPPTTPGKEATPAVPPGKESTPAAPPGKDPKTETTETPPKK